MSMTTTEWHRQRTLEMKEARTNRRMPSTVYRQPDAPQTTDQVTTVHADLVKAFGVLKMLRLEMQVMARKVGRMESLVLQIVSPSATDPPAPSRPVRTEKQLDELVELVRRA